MKWPCESTHRISVSLDGVEPVNITLPYPVFVPSVNPIALPRKGGVIEVVLKKALYDLWPDNIIDDRLRWNAEKLLPLTDMDTLIAHLCCQYCLGRKPEADMMTKVRHIIRGIFERVIGTGHERFQLKIEGSTDSPDWFIRAHPPVRMSPHDGSPILLLSALDHHLQERLQGEGKWDIGRAKKSFHRIFGHVPAEEKVVIPIESTEMAQILRYILRLNSTKVRPTSWQNENLPRGKSPSPWLATFVRPLYLDAVDGMTPTSTSSAVIEIDYCAKCKKKGGDLKLCGKCKAVSYCSFECRRADSSKHKSSCC